MAFKQFSTGFQLGGRRKSTGRLSKAMQAMQGVNPDAQTFPDFNVDDKAEGIRNLLAQAAPTRSPLEVPDQTTPTEQPKKRNWLSKVGDFMGTRMDEGTTKTDELGLPKPQVEKAGVGRKILEYALPTLFGIFGGAGAIPGLLTGLSAQAGRRGRNVKAEQEYGESRAKAIETRRKAEQAEQEAQDKITSAEKIAHIRASGEKKGAITKEESNAYSSISEEGRQELEDMTPAQLRQAMGDPNPVNKAAASYMLKIKLQSKPLEEY